MPAHHQLSSTDLSDIVSALREKAKGDREAAETLRSGIGVQRTLTDELEAHRKHKRLMDTLLDQAARMEKLADRLED
jgi:hypothetical protein